MAQEVLFLFVVVWLSVGVTACTLMSTHHDVFPGTFVEHRTVDIPVGTETLQTTKLTQTNRLVMGTTTAVLAALLIVFFKQEELHASYIQNNGLLNITSGYTWQNRPGTRSSLKICFKQLFSCQGHGQAYGSAELSAVSYLIDGLRCFIQDARLPGFISGL